MQADCDGPEVLNTQILPCALPWRARSTSGTCSSTVLISKPVHRKLPRAFQLPRGVGVKQDLTAFRASVPTTLQESSAGPQSENTADLVRTEVLFLATHKLEGVR